MKNLETDFIFLFKTKFATVLVKTIYWELEVPIIRSLGNKTDSDEWSTHVPSALHLVKTFRCPFKRSLGGPQSLSGRCGQERAPFAPNSIRAPDRPVRSYTHYRLYSTYEISIDSPKSWWYSTFMLIGPLQLVSNTVSWCCRLLLPREFAQTAVFIGIQME